MKYIALTIGPIYKTLSNAKKTRELWASSYIFSYIMKTLIKKIIEIDPNKEFITPNIKDQEIFKKGNEVGLFHDRFIFKSEKTDFGCLKLVIESTLRDISLEISKEISKKLDNVKLEDVESFIKNYFQISFIEKELDDNANAILDLSVYLDTLEQYQKVTPSGRNYLVEFLRRSNENILTDDAFNKNNSSESKYKVPSLPEIALKELHCRGPQEKSDLDFFKQLFEFDINKEDSDIFKELEKKFKEKYENHKGFKDLEEKYEDHKNLKNYHKYIAIVHADGDNLSEVLKENKDNLQTISKKLFEFAIDSCKKVSSFGGTTIYAGGDDLLFFAPVKNGFSTIFDLIDEIDKNFNKKFEDENKNLKKKASLSFGLSITYYKFPLYEALETSRNLLSYRAKTYEIFNQNYNPNGTKDEEEMFITAKNAIAFEVIKHSGKKFGVVLPKEENIYSKFKDLLLVIEDEESKSKSFLGSLHNKIKIQQTIINSIGKDKEKLKNFFKNNFNESEHKKYKDFFEKMIDFISTVYTNEKCLELKEKDKKMYKEMYKKLDSEGKKDNTLKPESDTKIDLIYSTLRFIKFIKGDED